MPLRMAGELRVKAEAIARKRRDAAQQREARERTQREREERAARERYPTGYVAAATLVVDLRDINGRNRGDAFAQRLATIRTRHAKKRCWLAW